VCVVGRGERPEKVAMTQLGIIQQVFGPVDRLHRQFGVSEKIDCLV
jgi:hypothetical protein